MIPLGNTVLIKFRIHEPPSHPGIDRLSELPVVVVLLVVHMKADSVLFAVQSVEPAETGELPHRGVMRPIPGAAAQHERPRGDQSGVVNIRVVETQHRVVFADAAAVKMTGDHYGRRRRLHPLVKRRQEICLGTSAGITRAAHLTFVDVVPGTQVIQQFERVVGLDGEGTVTPEVVALPLFSLEVGRVGQLPGVLIVVDHRPGERGEPLEGEVDKTMRHGRKSVLPRRRPPPGCVAVGVEHERQPATGVFPSRQVRLDVKTRKGFYT